MAKRNTVPSRIPATMHEQMNIAMNERFKKNLIKRKDCNLTEGFRLAQRQPEWQSILQKLRNVPKREDLR